MGRSQSTALTNIRAMCAAHKLDSTKLLTQTKYLLITELLSQSLLGYDRPMRTI